MRLERQFLRVLLLFSMFVMLIFSRNPTQASKHLTTVVYLTTEATTDGVQQSVNWREIGTTTSQSVPVNGMVTATALPPIGHLIAYATRTGDIQILDLMSAQQTSVPARLEVDFYFPWDRQFDWSKSMAWSPDGRLLAFIGLSDSGRRDLYIYEPTHRELTQLTASLSSHRMASPAWSPDSRQLAFLAAWDESDHFEAVMVSLDDPSTYKRIAPDYPACRLHWSSDLQHIASTATCYYNPQTLPANSDVPALTIFSLDGAVPITIPPVVNTEEVIFGSPHWIDEQTLVSLQTVNDLSSGEAISSTDAVVYNLTTRKFTSLTTLSDTMQGFAGGERQGDWDLWYTGVGGRISKYAYNPVNDLLYDLSGLYDCVTVMISPDGRYLGIPSGCDLNGPSIFRVYSVQEQQDILRIEAKETETITPLGFIEMN